MPTKSLFKSIEKKHDVFRGKDCMKKFCKSNEERKIINSEKEKMKLLTNKQQKPYVNAEMCYICKKTLKINILKVKKYCKVRDHCYCAGKYRSAAHTICNLKFSVPNFYSFSQWI